MCHGLRLLEGGQHVLFSTGFKELVVLRNQFKPPVSHTRGNVFIFLAGQSWWHVPLRPLEGTISLSQPRVYVHGAHCARHPDMRPTVNQRHPSLSLKQCSSNPYCCTGAFKTSLAHIHCPFGVNRVCTCKSLVCRVAVVGVRVTASHTREFGREKLLRVLPQITRGPAEFVSAT